MAHVLDHYELSVTLADQGGNLTTKRYQVNGGLLGVDLASNSDFIITKLLAVTNASLKAYSVSSVYIDDAFGLPSDAEVEELLLATVQLASSPLKKATFTIPAPKATLFMGSSGEPWNTADVADTALKAYSDLFTLPGPYAWISDGETAVATADGGLLNGKRIHRASRRG